MITTSAAVTESRESIEDMAVDCLQEFLRLSATT